MRCHWCRAYDANLAVATRLQAGGAEFKDLRVQRALSLAKHAADRTTHHLTRDGSCPHDHEPEAA